MRASYFYHLYQRHFAHWCDGFVNRFDARTRAKPLKTLVLAFLLAPVLLVCIVLGTHFLGLVFTVPVITLAVLGTAVIVGSCTYDYTYGSGLDDHRLKRISKLLAQQGPMHIAMLLNQYTRGTHDYMDSKDLTRLLTAYANRDRFVIDANIVALPGQPLAGIVPVPVDDDYVAGYHTLYRRLAAIRANPELATVPDGLIDDMYGGQEGVLH